MDARSLSRTVAATAAVATTLFGGGVARAAWTGPGGALHGCVSKHGVLKVISFNSRCNAGLHSVVFGAQGNAGPTGPQGGSGTPGRPARPRAPPIAAHSRRR